MGEVGAIRIDIRQRLRDPHDVDGIVIRSRSPLRCRSFSLPTAMPHWS